MQRYKEFAPTPFDSRGAFLRGHGEDDDRQEWWVVPVSQTRDTGPLSESNFETALEMLGGESGDVEVHRFGHWGPGWFEIILVRPDTTAANTAAEIERSLEDYPILDESDYSERNWEDMSETWRSLSLRERIDIIKNDGESGTSIFAARHDWIPELRHEDSLQSYD